jgi:hypothetical protein
VTVTVPASGDVLVTLTSYMAPEDSDQGGSMGFSSNGECPGATVAGNVEAEDARSLQLISVEGGASAGQASATYLVTGLSAGSHAFIACYRSDTANLVEFKNRSIIVTPLS